MSVEEEEKIVEEIITPDWAKDDEETADCCKCDKNKNKKEDEFPFEATMSIENFEEYLQKNNDKLKEEGKDYIRNLHDKRGMNFLHCACINDCDDLIEILINEYKIDINELDNDGYSPLFYCVNQWNAECVEKLLVFNPKLDLITKDCVIYATGFPIYICGGRNILHQAAEINSVQCCKLILNYMTSNNDKNILFQKDFNGFTPIDIAKMENKLEMLKLFSEFAIDQKNISAIKDEKERKLMKREYNLKTRKRIKENQIKQEEKEEMDIANNYKPKYPKLFFQKDNEYFPLDLLDKTLLSLIKELNDEHDEKNKMKIVKKYECEPLNFLVSPLEGIWIFRVFNDDLCDKLLMESENYIQESLNSKNHGLLPIKRPNSMNAYGLVLNSIGMKKSWTYFIQQIIKPLSDALIPCKTKKYWDFKNHHTFIIRYKNGEDVNLDTHIDASAITLNVCLGKPGFEGAKVYFHGIDGMDNKDSYKSPHPDDDSCKYCQYQLFHKIGFGVLHVGNYIHGTKTLQKGERSNVVIWCKE